MPPTGRRKAPRPIFHRNGASHHPVSGIWSVHPVSASSPAARKPRSLLSARRLALLATVAVLGAGVFFSAPAVFPQSNATFLASPAYAQSAQRPVGFADIVEKVKPSVISVRVKVDGGARQMRFEGESPFPPGSPME